MHSDHCYTVVTTEVRLRNLEDGHLMKHALNTAKVEDKSDMPFTITVNGQAVVVVVAVVGSLVGSSEGYFLLKRRDGEQRYYLVLSREGRFYFVHAECSVHTPHIPTVVATAMLLMEV